MQKFTEMMSDARAAFEKGNQSAARRARKNAQWLRVTFKDLRAQLQEAAKAAKAKKEE